MPEISTVEIRRRILKEHGLKPHRVPNTVEAPEPYDESKVDFIKTSLMRYIEEKYNILLKNDIYIGSINDVCSRYKWEVDRATISRWRKYIRRFLIDHPNKRTFRPFVKWGMHK